MFWAFEKGMFPFFASFWLTKLKPFSGKKRQSEANYLNQDLVIGSFLKNRFEATLSSKTNVLSIWKGHVSVFCKFLIDEVETVFWEKETKWGKLFKSRFSHRKLLRKWFWGYLELKSECSERFKKTCFSFFKFFSSIKKLRRLTHFSITNLLCIYNYLLKKWVNRCIFHLSTFSLVLCLFSLLLVETFPMIHNLWKQNIVKHWLTVIN